MHDQYALFPMHIASRYMSGVNENEKASGNYSGAAYYGISSICRKHCEAGNKHDLQRRPDQPECSQCRSGERAIIITSARALARTHTAARLLRAVPMPQSWLGDDNAVRQGVAQQACGSSITQSGANALAVLGDNNSANQQISQAAFGQNIFQNGWNTGSITGDDNTLMQGLLSMLRPMGIAIRL